MHNQQIKDFAKGKWQSILPEFGIDRKYHNHKHGPCPMCGGKDRWRFDDKNGLGTYFCSNCGSGDGFTLLSKKTHLSFADIAQKIRNLSNLSVSYKPIRQMSDEELQRRKKMLWERSESLSIGDPVCRYLASRGIAPEALRVPSSVLRIAKDVLHPETKVRSYAMLAKVVSPNNQAVNIHITYINEQGQKLDRRVMRGSLPEGCAVRLGQENQVMGIAEGIETALSASRLFNLPVWAALNANQLSKWIPPKICNEVWVFGDNDLSYTGQYKAYELANKLTRLGFAVSVFLPKDVGNDWNDELNDEED